MLLLPACSTKSADIERRVALPAVPPDIRSCFKAVINIPHRSLTAKEMVRIIAQQRRALLNANACGRQLVAWHDDVRRLLGPR